VTLLDVTRTDDRHTAQRLSAEPIIWLGTVRPDGRPHNVPVWFTWHDPMVLIFSMPKTAKVRDVRL
jgi:nitroimidazol reductase NimA-like FMN-containing flavoprotein (pyridoxamine 5'-phosphate oxidase superfamily)